MERQVDVVAAQEQQLKAVSAPSRALSLPSAAVVVLGPDPPAQRRLREEQISASAAEWTTEILPDWERKRHAARTHELVWTVGVPSHVSSARARACAADRRSVR